MVERIETMCPGPVDKDVEDKKALEDLLRDLAAATEEMERARLKREIGKVLNSQGKLREARSVLEESLDIFKKAKAGPDDVIMAMVDLAGVTGRIGDLDKAEEISWEALRLSTPTDVKGVTKGWAALTYGLSRLLKGDNEAGMKHFERALNLFETSRSSDGVARASHCMGNIYTTRSLFGKALAYYNKAIKINEELGKRDDVMGTMLNVAVAKREQGLYFDALKGFNQVIEHFRHTDDVRVVAIATTNIGHTYLHMRRWDDALVRYNESSQLCSKMGERWIDSYNTFARSEALLGKGEGHKAEENMRESFHNLMGSGSEEIKGRTLRVRGMIFREQGELEKAEKDFDLSEKSLRAGELEVYRALLYIEWAKAAWMGKERKRAGDMFNMARKIYVDLKLPLLERNLSNTMKQFGY